MESNTSFLSSVDRIDSCLNRDNLSEDVRIYLVGLKKILCAMEVVSIASDDLTRCVLSKEDRNIN